MFEQLDNLERLIKPLEAAERLGYKTSQENGQFVTRCPYCGGSLWVQPDGYLCRNDDCQMLAGSVLELAAARTKTYAGGMQDLQRCFGDRLRMSPEFSDTHDLDVVRQARTRRRMFSQVRKLMRSSQDTSARTMFLDDLARQGVHDPGHHLIGIVTVQDMKQLAKVLQEAGAEVPKTPETTLMMVPYWVNPHLPAALLLQHPRGQWQHVIELRPYKVALAGIHMLTPDTKRVWLYNTAVEAGTKNAGWSARDPEQVGLTYLLGDGNADPAVLPDVTCLASPEQEHTSVVRLHDLYPGMRVASADREAVEFDQHLFNSLRPFIRRGALTSAGLVLLGSYNPQGRTKQQLHSRLLKAGHGVAADQVSRSLYSVEIARADRHVVYETPEGYGIRRSGGQLELFSNFIIRPTGNVTFGEGTAPHHAVEVLIGGQEFSSILPSRMLDSPRELQEHVQVLTASRRASTVPVLRDPTAFRNVSCYLRGSLPKLPTAPGLPFLGWNSKRDSFFMPGLVITPDAPLQGRFHLHPDVLTLDAYSPVVPEGEALSSDLPLDVQTLILMILGSLMRGHRGEQMQHIQIRHDGKAASLLAGLFRGLGQERAVTRVERNPEGLHNYPAWATAGRVAGKVPYPWFVLAPQGWQAAQHHSDEVLTRAAITLKVLTRQVVEALLAMPDPHEWQPCPSVLYSSGLVRQAQVFCQERCGVTLQAELPVFEWVERLLYQIPREDVAKHMSYNFNEQKVLCDLTPFRGGLDMVSLELELRRLADTVAVKSASTLELDAYSAFSLLGSYYGGTPELAAAN